MRSLKDWNKIINGRFTKNPAVGTYLSIADTKGMSMECTVLHKNGEIWHIGEQHLPRPALPGWHAPQNLGGKGTIVESVNMWGRHMAWEQIIICIVMKTAVGKCTIAWLNSR